MTIDLGHKDDDLSLVDLHLLKEYAGVSTNTFRESFSFEISNDLFRTNNVIVFCLSSYRSYEDSLFPTITLRDKFLDSKWTQSYIVGGRTTKEFKQWRYLRLLGDTNTLIISFDIPAGVELDIESFGVYLDNSITRDGFKFFEHDLYWAGTINSSLAFQQSDGGSYYGAVVVPKLTVDGVFVCYHDDNTLATNNDLQMLGGNPISFEMGALRMDQLTFTQTQMLEYKVSNILGDHSRIPTLEEFFINCAKTGVHPCLSCHQTYTASQWEIIRDLAGKYDLLDKLTIKHGANLRQMNEVFNVFGNSLEMYLWNVSSSSLTSYIEDLRTVKWDLSRVKVGLEFMSSFYALDALSSMSALTELGYVWGVYENTPDILTLTTLKKEGCFEWTIGSFFSNGLNW